MQKNFLQEIRWRGLLQDQTSEIEGLMSKERVVGYAGFDPTAASLHVGNLVPVMLLVHLQRCGHKPIALVGGATGMIGDPSGKSQERNLLSQDVLVYNLECQTAQLKSFLSFEGENAAEVLNNYTWYEHFRMLDFLRDVGKHLTVNYMMAKDSVQKRLETGLSFTEFSYQLLQAYDFYYLYKHKNVKLQVGGSDQWGNITSGIELVRKMAQGEVHGITAPLLTKSDGSKFGKSESGNIWLDPNMTSPYKFYQFFLNVADADLGKLLKIFSFKEEEEINVILAESKARPEARIGQKALAEEMTERLHGKDALKFAVEASQILFGNSTTEVLKNLSPAVLAEVLDGVPSATLNKTDIESGLGILDLLVQSGAKPSKAEAKRAIQAGSVRINKEKVTSMDAQMTTKDLINERFILIQIGKITYHVAIFE
jgi:tyrosyl-tRNA synthetase